MRLTKTIVAAAIACVGAFPAVAHHSTTTFYFTNPIEVSGDIEELVWANPHGILVVKDAKGGFWVGELAAVVDLAAQGLNPTKLPKGLHVDLKALPSRDGSNRIHIQVIKADGNVIFDTKE